MVSFSCIYLKNVIDLLVGSLSCSAGCWQNWRLFNLGSPSSGSAGVEALLSSQGRAFVLLMSSECRVKISEAKSKGFTASGSFLLKKQCRLVSKDWKAMAALAVKLLQMLCTFRILPSPWVIGLIKWMSWLLKWLNSVHLNKCQSVLAPFWFEWLH